MRIVTSFPREVLDIENVFIPLRDGTRLAARLWRPVDAESTPVPAILEYIPYRKGDRMRERDEPMHGYFAGHGYAAVRVDLRGTGDSEGVLLDEYHAQEIEDALDVIDWLRKRPWCNGKVGMMGKSWGGFNALQVASRRPEGLGAVISVCASDDRYADDAHYMGGCLLNENLVWGSALLTLSVLPPDPKLWGEPWREIWRGRLESAALFPERWLRHPWRDDYWKHGSVREDYAAVACPVYAVGGWSDPYTNAIPRLLEALRAPRKGLVGPWAHLYPHNGVPGPAVGFLQEALRWWDHWLLGRDTGIMDEPMYRVWMPEPALPAERALHSPGRFVAEPHWPSKEILWQRYFLEGGLLLETRESGGGGMVSVRSPLTAGLAAGSWCPFGAADEMPLDQREDDAKSLLFDSPPLPARFEILGAPELRLRLASDRPRGMIAARLEDVFPDGVSVRVTYGLLNLTHRDGHEEPAELVPGNFYDVTLRLNDTAYSFLPGHRLRLALSSSYWPVAWPSPEAFALSLDTGRSRMDLPRRPPRPEDSSLRPFEPPESAPNARAVELVRGGTSKRVSQDPVSGEIVYRFSADFTESGEPALTRVEATGMEHGHGIVEIYALSEPDPLSARAEVRHEARFRREGWSVRIRTAARLTSSSSEFHVEGEIEAFENDASVFLRTWRSALPRKLL